MTRKAPTPSKRLAIATPASRAEERANGKKSRAPRPAGAQSVIQQHLFPIVGVGASAGGLEALTALLQNLPSDSGMAFVIIQHLDPKHASQLTELLSKATKMPILEVDAGMAVEPNHVYVIAPGVSLSLSGGRLRAEPRDTGPSLPIDHFLRSLAQDKGSNAIGVVLSGTATDGTLGLRAVQAEGGITFAQEPASAKFDGMPRNAIAAGVVDFVLAPEAIAQRLVQISQRPYAGGGPAANGHPPEEMEFELNKIFHLLRTATGTDFTHYKHATIQRRLRRRMVLQSTQDLGDYIGYLEANPAEVRVLADDLLIRVTSFFRVPEALKALTTKVFPEMIRTRSLDDSIRIWVPGCATGEEAYSIAICLTELLEQAGTKLRIQIFATDVSETAVNRARAGIYGMPALAEVSPERLKRFFIKVEGGYQIHKSIRETCIFAKQDLTKDPPFHKLDLITCCNVLIYFGPVLQTRALSIFHFALKPGGFLMLGPSESVGTLASSFAAVDRKLKLYSRQELAPKHLPSLAGLPLKVPRDEPTTPNVRATLDVQKTAERMLLAQYAPAGVIVDDAMNVVNVRGDTGPYLQVASGEPTYNLLKMAREGLAIGLRSAMVKARKENVSISQQARLKQSGEFRKVNVKVVPINGSVHSDSPHFMVLFEEINALLVPSPSEGAAQREIDSGKPLDKNGVRGNRENERLKEELTSTREYLQSIVEEQEATCEELKSANEEAQASNEELETAKEELQSANEELNTVNDEQRTQNSALGDANNDLTNVLASINVPLVMVGKDLKIRRFTQPMERMLNLIPSDIGRSISDLKSNIDVPNLPELLRTVIDGASPSVREIQGPLGRWFSLQALPYKVPGNRIEGALLVMLDINAVKNARNYAEAIVETVRQPLLVLTKELKIRSANQAFYSNFKVSKEETENCFLYDLGDGQWNIPKLREALGNILPSNGSFQDFEVEHKFEGIGRRTMLLSARELKQLTPNTEILLAIEDITERRSAEDQIRRTNEDLKHFAYAASHDLQEPLRMVMTSTQLLSRDYQGKLDKDADQFIAYAVEGAQRMESLLKGMREYWQASERGEEHRRLVDCNEILGKALLNLEVAINKSGAAVTHALLPTVWAEQIMLLQLFQNLVGNAIKYRGQKPPKVHVSAEESEGEWIFSVKDNGIGIATEHAKRVFDMFKRLNGEKYPGAGIGLAICRKVVERLGGQIWVESEKEQGSNFKFTVPLRGQSK